MASAATLDAGVLARLLLIQNMVGQLHGAKAICSFVCRGLEDMPGIREVRHLEDLAQLAELQREQWRIVALVASERSYGWLALQCVDAAAFEPYEPYVGNVGFMVSVVLEGQRLSRLEQNRRAELEARVSERTRELTDLVSQLELARQKGEEERQKAERYLELSEAMIVELDVRGRVVVINKHGAQLLGCSVPELIGKDWFEVALPQELRSETRNLFTRFMESGANLQAYQENEILGANGGRRRIAWHNSLRFDNDGTVVGTLSSGIDVTDRVRLMEAVQQSEKMRSLGVLAGGIAHDFNNLLTGIFGHLELAASSRDAGSETKAHLEQSQQAFARARSLTHQLLTFARGGHPIRRTVELPPLIRDTVEFVLAGSAIRRQYDFPSSLGASSVDENQLAQVLENLCINALQAMPKGGMLAVAASNAVVRVGDSTGLSPGDYVVIRFEDTGPGIPSADSARIFDPFFTTKTQGLGLGLASAYSIVKRHGGLLEVASEAGRGAVFRIYLPRSVAVPAQARLAPAADGARTGRGRVLVMDDEQMLRSLVGRQLARLGYDAVTASSGDAAVAIIKGDASVVIAILDLTVPGGMGGLEAAKHVREIRSDIRLIATSGYAEDPVLARPGDYGFDGALPKPFRKQELASVLDAMLEPGNGISARAHPDSG